VVLIKASYPVCAGFCDYFCEFSGLARRTFPLAKTGATYGAIAGYFAATNPIPARSRRWDRLVKNVDRVYHLLGV
jgi:hypothetical protein